jgi:hypothetical protein
LLRDQNHSVRFVGTDLRSWVMRGKTNAHHRDADDGAYAKQSGA